MKHREQMKILRSNWRTYDLDAVHARGGWGSDAFEVRPGRLCAFGSGARTGDVVRWGGTLQIVTDHDRPMDPGDQVFLSIEPLRKPHKLPDRSDPS